LNQPELKQKGAKKRLFYRGAFLESNWQAMLTDLIEVRLLPTYAGIPGITSLFIIFFWL
jgi:hypothetical protein